MSISAPIRFAPDPCLYKGRVIHVRHGAVRHRLKYKVGSLLLPLHKMDEADRMSRLFSINRFNLISFHEADHMDPGFGNLQDYVQVQLRQSGQFRPDETLPDRISLLAFPRLLGHTFNPLSIFFCCDAQDQLQAILYQVNNTFGQRHHYLVRTDHESGIQPMHHDGEKRFYVSPFLDMKGHYRFVIRPPSKTAAYQIHMSGDQPSSLSAYYAAERQALTDRTLLATFGPIWQAGWKTLAAIHFEAVRLLLKGAPFHKRPPLPPQSVTNLTAHDPSGKGTLS